MKKIIVHRVKVDSRNVRFQIRLPRNTKAIEAVAVSCPDMAGENVTHEVGAIWLTIPERRDTFFADVVRLQFSEFNIDGFAPMVRIAQITSYTHWTEGTKYAPLTVFVEGCVTLIEGFYVDYLGEDAEGEYTVNVYLTLEV